MFTQPLEMSPSSFLQKCMFFNPKNDFPLFSNKNESTHPYLFQLLHSTTSYHGYVMELVVYDLERSQYAKNEPHYCLGWNGGSNHLPSEKNSVNTRG